MTTARAKWHAERLREYRTALPDGCFSCERTPGVRIRGISGAQHTIQEVHSCPSLSYRWAAVPAASIMIVFVDRAPVAKEEINVPIRRSLLRSM
jgi:hypothetical protein